MGSTELVVHISSTDSNEINGLDASSIAKYVSNDPTIEEEQATYQTDNIFSNNEFPTLCCIEWQQNICSFISIEIVNSCILRITSIVIIWRSLSKCYYLTERKDQRACHRQYGNRALRGRTSVRVIGSSAIEHWLTIYGNCQELHVVFRSTAVVI